MTTEQKAKAYDEALNKAKIEISTKGIGETVDLCKQLFPQLAKSDDEESEDERIINQLITLVNSAGEVLLIPTNKEELVAWLNKCKESLHTQETCKENADSFTDEDERIRKFLIQHISEWIGCIEHDLKNSSKDIESEKELAMFKAGLAWLEKQKERGPLTKEEKYTLHCIIEYLDDETCPSEWISLLHGIYCLPYGKQKENIEKEYVFRPLGGTDITVAAEQAIKRANEGERLVLAFNGAYIPVRKGCNVNKIVDIYNTFVEKQQEPPFVKDVNIGYPGYYFYDGKRMYLCSSPALEEIK